MCEMSKKKKIQCYLRWVFEAKHVNINLIIFLYYARQVYNIVSFFSKHQLPAAGKIYIF